MTKLETLESQLSNHTGISEIIQNQRNSQMQKRQHILAMLLTKKSTLEPTLARVAYFSKWKDLIIGLENKSVKIVV